MVARRQGVAKPACRYERRDTLAWKPNRKPCKFGCDFCLCYISRLRSVICIKHCEIAMWMLTMVTRTTRHRQTVGPKLKCQFVFEMSAYKSWYWCAPHLHLTWLVRHWSQALKLFT
jgi:hypothetical protein